MQNRKRSPFFTSHFLCLMCTKLKLHFLLIRLCLHNHLQHFNAIQRLQKFILPMHLLIDHILCVSTCICIKYTAFCIHYVEVRYEPRHERTGFLHMRKQRRRSASRLDQLRGNREADQRLCFRYIASTIPLLPKYEISSL